MRVGRRFGGTRTHQEDQDDLSRRRRRRRRRQRGARRLRPLQESQGQGQDLQWQDHGRHSRVLRQGWQGTARQERFSSFFLLSILLPLLRFTVRGFSASLLGFQSLSTLVFTFWLESCSFVQFACMHDLGFCQCLSWTVDTLTDSVPCFSVCLLVLGSAPNTRQFFDNG